MRRTVALLAFGSQQTRNPGAMPLVFVHGVNVRKQSQSDRPGQPTAYEKVVARRDGFFGEIALKPIAADPARLVIKNPYWGDEAAKFPWGQGALPDDEYERFGREADLDPELVLPATAMGPLYALDDESPPEAILPWLARRSMAAAVDLLVMTANDPVAPLAGTSELARLADGLGGYAESFSNRSPDWLDNVQTDAQFVDRLTTAIRDFRDDTPGRVASGRVSEFSTMLGKGSAMQLNGLSGLPPKQRGVASEQGCVPPYMTELRAFWATPSST